MAYEWIVDALESTWRSIDDVLGTKSPDAFNAATLCPGWTVQDVVSHLVGFELMLHGEPVPQYDSPWPSYVKNPIGEVNEAFVHEFRALSGTEVLALFRRTAERSIASLRSLSDDEWSRVGWSPEGDRPYFRLQETRVLDSWIHLHDIRDALLEPGDDHGPGEEIVVNRFEAALPYVLAKRVGASEGTSMRINLSGRLARSVLLHVEGGRASVIESSETAPNLELTTAVALFWRRAAGRIPADVFLGASATHVRGDVELANAFSDALAIMI